MVVFVREKVEFRLFLLIKFENGNIQDCPVFYLGLSPLFFPKKFYFQPSILESPNCISSSFDGALMKNV